MDRQEAKLRAQLEGTGVSVTRRSCGSTRKCRPCSNPRASRKAAQIAKVMTPRQAQLLLRTIEIGDNATSMKSGIRAARLDWHIARFKRLAGIP